MGIDMILVDGEEVDLVNKVRHEFGILRSLIQLS